MLPKLFHSLSLLILGRLQWCHLHVWLGQRHPLTCCLHTVEALAYLFLLWTSYNPLGNFTVIYFFCWPRFCFSIIQLYFCNHDNSRILYWQHEVPYVSFIYSNFYLFILFHYCYCLKSVASANIAISKAPECRLANLPTSYHAYTSLHQYVTFPRPQSSDLPTSYHAYKSLHQNGTFLRPQSADLPTSYHAYKSLHKYSKFLGTLCADLQT